MRWVRLVGGGLLSGAVIAYVATLLRPRRPSTYSFAYQPPRPRRPEQIDLTAAVPVAR